MSGQSAHRRTLALNGWFETGGFYSGTRVQTIAGLTSDVFRVIADSQFSPFMPVVNNIQYDTISRVIGWQWRCR